LQRIAYVYTAQKEVGLGREVAAELGADHTRLAVRAGDLAPDDADLGAADLLS
jgi:hypothetical protein